MPDTFASEQTRIPTAVGDIAIVLTDYLDNTQQPDAISFTIQIIYDNGDVETRSGNLVPYMTATQIQNVQNFAAAMRAKAESEVIT